ncbi:MFS transporter [Streptomyces sp. NPDC048172]|uniref:MFS transporter n=1 Tax=Streptomyces sp. NPDC048172 TaxID=3365505 RepID=UPI0037219B2C
MSAEPNARNTAGPREWAGLAVLALPTLLLALDISVLHLAVPHLAADLRPSGGQMLWIIDIYGFMIAGFLVAMGTLGDRIGRRRLLLVGASAFGVASVAAAYATGPELLIAARLVLGIAGATLMPSTLSLITNLFRDARQRGLAIAVWATMFSVGIALGPVVGGVLLEHFWWGSVFLLGVPVMAVLLVAGPLLLPESRDPAPGRLDLPSVLLSLTALLPLTYGIKELSHGFGAGALAPLAVGLGSAVWFVRRQRGLDSPLLDVRLFADRVFSSALVVLLLSTLTVGGIYLFVTQYLQLVAGKSALEAGLWLLPPAGALVLASLVAPVLARRYRPGTVIGAFLGVSAAGYLLLTQVGADSGVGLLVAGFVLVYTGASPVMALGTDLIVGSAPPEKAGAASAISETSTELGVALGVAVLGSAGTAVYRERIAHALPAEALPEGASDAARDTLAGASAAAEELPGTAANELLGAAHAAFADGMTVAALISAVVVAGIAVLAVTGLRRVPPTGAEGSAEPMGSGAPVEPVEPVETAKPAETATGVPAL